MTDVAVLDRSEPAPMGSGLAPMSWGLAPQRRSLSNAKVESHFGCEINCSKIGVV